jgi:transposase
MAATTLFGIDGVEVVEVDAEDDGSATVYVRTAVPVACPDCGTRAPRVKQWVSCRPRDVPYGRRRVRVVWIKRRWYCCNQGCRRASFTESLEDLPPRRRLTTRLRGGCAAAVAEHGRTVAEVADTHAVSWDSAHAALVEVVDSQLAAQPGPVTHLGIDEVRRGGLASKLTPTLGTPGRWLTGGTPGSPTCPASRACWARSRAAQAST